MRRYFQTWFIVFLSLSFVVPSYDPSTMLEASCYGGCGTGNCYGNGPCGVSCHDPYQMIGGAAVLGGIVGAITGYVAGNAKKGDRGDPGFIGPPGPPGPLGPGFLPPFLPGMLTINFAVEDMLEGDGVLRGLVALPDNQVLKTADLMTGESEMIVLQPEVLVGSYTLSWFVVAPFTGPDPTILGTITADNVTHTATYETPEFAAADQPAAGDQIFFEYIFPNNPI